MRFYFADDARQRTPSRQGLERKLRLRSAIAELGVRLLHSDHIDQDGEGLFGLACEHDLEGIVAKWKLAPYLPDQPANWLKIRDRSYSRRAGREELFERERGRDPGPDLR